MAKYSVFIPARKGTDMPDLTIRVEASNWLVALKEGLKQIGEQGDALANIVCETAKDGSLRVADPGSRRVFVLRQVTDEAADAEFQKKAEAQAAESRRLAEAAASAKAATEAQLHDVERRMTAATMSVHEIAAAAKAAQEAQARAAADAAKAAAQAAVEAEAAKQAQAAAGAEAARVAAAAAQEVKAAQEAKHAAELHKLEEERRRMEAELAAARKRAEEMANKAAAEATGVVGKVEVEKVEHKKVKKEVDDLDDWYDGVTMDEKTIDGVMSDIFLATESLHRKTKVEAANLILDLALKHVKAEAASVFYTDLGSTLADLMIVAARGPVGAKLEGVKLPLGKGIVGFCVAHALKMIVNSVDKNPNFYGEMDKQMGFHTRSILCIPLVYEDRLYGAVELVNARSEDGKWATSDANVVESLGKILSHAVADIVAAQK